MQEAIQNTVIGKNTYLLIRDVAKLLGIVSPRQHIVRFPPSAR